MDRSTEIGNFQLQLEAAVRCRLGRLWDNTVLTGTFWRLYRNRSDDAGVLVGGRRFPIRAGRFYLLPPGGDLPTYCDNPETEQLFLHFNLFFLSGTAPIFAMEPEVELDRLAARLEDALDADSPLVALYALALAGAALTRLPAEAFASKPCDFAVVRVCEFLRVNLQKQLGVEEMAALARLSPGEFARRFRLYTGSTPYRYLSDLRYERAERLLRSGKYGIDEICDRVGINDRFHFSRCFKRRYGYSPGVYRDQSRP